MTTIYDLLFSWIPNSNLRLAILALISLSIVFIVIRLVKIVLDSLPFL